MSVNKSRSYQAFPAYNSTEHK